MIGELISWMSDDALVFFHTFKNGYLDANKKQRVKLRVWHPSLGCYVTIQERAEVARNLKAIRKTGIGFKKLP